MSLSNGKIGRFLVLTQLFILLSLALTAEAAPVSMVKRSEVFIKDIAPYIDDIERVTMHNYAETSTEKAKLQVDLPGKRLERKQQGQQGQQGQQQVATKPVRIQLPPKNHRRTWDYLGKSSSA
ncbi:uncharacterized protein SPSC_06630 [Sporisorium scitamineum]|uniref:Uncharacterized protein n=1 Tax=Sporisorium scitamineum TaxID=49012 RepID=A0A0F7S9E2_9BASI|nr:uncharacterized protein SPSC_06630 [Sporisorium scitamineum]CDW98876.1 hypothetical protein [Sporisorium scitamineum]